MDSTDIQPLENKTQFPCLDLGNFISILRPFEAVLLKPFLPEAKTVSVPVKDFEYCPTPIAEYKEVAGKGLCGATHNPFYVAHYDMCRRPGACSQALNPTDFVTMAGDT